MTRLWMCLAPVIACGIDSVHTFVKQRPEYWAGDYSQAYDGNPIVQWALEQHPIAAFIIGCLWLGLVCAACLALPLRWARFVSAFVTLMHFGATTTMVLYLYGSFWPQAIILSLVIAFVMTRVLSGAGEVRED